jgi:hypothetical protein
VIRFTAAEKRRDAQREISGARQWEGWLSEGFRVQDRHLHLELRGVDPAGDPPLAGASRLSFRDKISSILKSRA